MTTLMATHHKHQEESDLVRQAAHDVEAFAELYRRNLARVNRYHMPHVGNVRDAEDLTSQTFMAALEGIRSFRGTGSFAAWILGIATKKRLMFFRRNGSRPEVSLDAALQTPARGYRPIKRRISVSSLNPFPVPSGKFPRSGPKRLSWFISVA